MSKREFSKVSSAIWRSRRFQALASDRARLLLFYFITCQHQNSAGTFKIPEGYVTTDLGWTLEEYRKERAILIDADLIAYDTDTDEVYVRGWFNICPPMNDKHAAGTLPRIDDIDSAVIREVVTADFIAVDAARIGKRFRARQAGHTVDDKVM